MNTYDIDPIVSKPTSVPRYTDLGCYAILYLSNCSDVFCPDCVDRLAEQGDETPLTQFVHWEGAPEYCCECNTELQSEYGEET